MANRDDLQTFLLSDLRYLAICIFMKDYSQKKPISTKDLMESFGSLSNKLILQLQKMGAINKRSPHSPMVFLSKEARAAVSEIETWSDKLHGELVKMAEIQVVTSEPLRIRNLRVSNVQTEAVTFPSSINSFKIGNDILLVTDAAPNPTQRFLPLSCEMNTDQKMMATTGEDFKIPTTALSAQMKKIKNASHHGNGGST